MDPLIRKLSFKTAAGVLLLLLYGAILYHILIISGIVPYKYTWGGRLKDREEMLIMEGISISINLFMIWIVTMRKDPRNSFLSEKTTRILCLILCIVFALNTLGNLTALEHLEAIVFTPVTLISAICFYRLWLKEP